MSAPATTVEEAVATVSGRIAAACARSGRNPAEVTIIAASKSVDVAGILAALRSGITDFGENRVQEAMPKVEALAMEPRIRWHFIGQLQRNKAKSVAQHFDAVHSVDSASLLAALDRSATQPIDVFLQVNLTGAPAQGGIDPVELPDLVAQARSSEQTRLLGLMTIGRLSDDPEDSRPVFQQLAALGRAHKLPGLSMGMTNDFEVAIMEGATHIRVGRALFGERP